MTVTATLATFPTRRTAPARRKTAARFTLPDGVTPRNTSRIAREFAQRIEKTTAVMIAEAIGAELPIFDYAPGYFEDDNSPTQEAAIRHSWAVERMIRDRFAATLAASPQMQALRDFATAALVQAMADTIETEPDIA